MRAKKYKPREPDPALGKRVREMEKLRVRGWTWALIGSQFGMSRQAASQSVKKYRKKNPRHL